VTVIDGATNEVVTTIGVGTAPIALAWNPAQNRVYVANQVSSSISVLRDSMSGVEESHKPRASSGKLEPTVLSGASGVRRLASSVLFDAMGRRVVNPKPGVYFVRDAQAQAQAQAVRKVIITK
jgi:hypothetical protein